MLPRRTRPIFKRKPRRLRAGRPAMLALLLALALPAQAQAPAPLHGDGSVLLSLVLPPGRTTVEGLGAALLRDGVLQAVPPEGLRVESWYEVAGLGQLVTLRVPPALLREPAPRRLDIASH